MFLSRITMTEIPNHFHSHVCHYVSSLLKSNLSGERKKMNGKSYIEIKLVQHIKIFHFQTPGIINEVDGVVPF